MDDIRSTHQTLDDIHLRGSFIGNDYIWIKIKLIQAFIPKKYLR